MAAEHARLRAADGGEVDVEDAELAAHVVHGGRAADAVVLPEVRHVGVLRHLAQRDPLTSAGDEDRHARLLHGARPDIRAVDAGVLPGERERLLAPHAADDADRLLQRGLPLPWGRERQPHAAELLRGVADAEPEHHPPAAQPVHVGRLPRDQHGAPVVHARHE